MAPSRSANASGANETPGQAGDHSLMLASSGLVVTVAFTRSVVADMLAVAETGSMKEIEKALAEVAQAKVNATTASGRRARGLIVVASYLQVERRPIRHFVCQPRPSILARSSGRDYACRCDKPAPRRWCKPFQRPPDYRAGTHALRPDCRAYSVFTPPTWLER